MQVYVIYRLWKDTQTNAVRVGQTARLRERLRDHFSMELRAWRELRGPMQFLQHARLDVVATTDDRKEALRLERQEQERATAAGLELTSDPTAVTFTRLPRKLDGTGRKPRERTEETWPVGAVLHGRELCELLQDRRRARGDETRRRVLEQLSAIPTGQTVNKTELARRAGVKRWRLHAILREIQRSKTTTPNGHVHKVEFVPGENMLVDARVKQFATAEPAKQASQLAESEADAADQNQRHAEGDVLRLRKLPNGDSVVDADEQRAMTGEELWDRVSGNVDELTLHYTMWEQNPSAENRRAYIEAHERATPEEKERACRKLTRLPGATPLLPRKRSTKARDVKRAVKAQKL